MASSKRSFRVLKRPHGFSMHNIDVISSNFIVECASTLDPCERSFKPSRTDQLKHAGWVLGGRLNYTKLFRSVEATSFTMSIILCLAVTAVNS